MPRARAHPIVRLQRAAQVFELLKMDATIDEIAEVLALEPTEVRRLVSTQVAQAKADVAEQARVHRQIQVERLEDLLAAVWPSAMGEPDEDEDPVATPRKPSKTSIDLALKILRRQSILLGLDAPTKHAHAVDATVRHGLDLSSLSGVELDALERTLIDTLTQAGGSRLPPGALVVDVEPQEPGGGAKR